MGVSHAEIHYVNKHTLLTDKNHKHPIFCNLHITSSQKKHQLAYLRFEFLGCEDGADKILSALH